MVPASPPAPVEQQSKASSAGAKPAASPLFQAGPRAGAPIIDSVAMTKVGDVDWNELLANEDLSTRVESGAESGMRFRSANEPDFIPVPSTFAPITPLPAVNSDKPIHKQAWQSSDTAKRRQMLTLATIGITGTLFAIGCFVVFIRMVGGKSQPIANVPVVAPKLPGLKEPETDGQNAIDQSANQDKITEVTPPIQDRVPAVETPGTTSLLPPTSVPTPSTDASTVLSTVPQGTNDGDSIPSVFEFGGLLSVLGKDNTSLDLTTPISDVPELNVENATVYLEQIFHPLPKPIPNWDENSKLVLSSFRKKDITLLRCIDLFGRMTGIGITVDWQSCRVAGIDLAKKIEINEKDKSISELMAQIVLANGLEWALDGRGLPVVSAPKAAMEARMQVDWSIAELFPEGAEQAGCDALIRLWGFEEVCSLVEGRLQWSEQATPVEKANMQASLFQLAKLRHLDANHAWSKSPDFPLVYSASHWNNSFAALDRRISPSVVAPERRPIPDLLMTAAAETKLNLIIDWQNVWRHGLTPKESTAIVLGGRTFPQTAKRFLTDYALEIVPILDDTVWLTTREERRKLIRVVPVRMPKNYKLDDLRQSLRKLAPIVDEVSRFKIVPIPGTEDLFFARICSPRADQLNDPDVMLGLGWTDRP